MRDKQRSLNNKGKKDELTFLKNMIREMPEYDPPSFLVEEIISSLEPKKLSWWQKIYIWLTSSHSITVSPLKLVPAAAIMMVIVLFFGYQLFQKSNYSSNTTQNLTPITFILCNSSANSVSLIGSFNNWRPNGFEMKRKNGCWIRTLMLPTGRYEYAFLVDGKRVISDPNALFTKRDGFGHLNSIIFVGYDGRQDNQNV